MSKPKSLLESFVPESYELSYRPDGDRIVGRVKIAGRKVGRPSQRITLHQRQLKVTSAKLIHIDKHGSKEIELKRINPHQKFEELRLHAGTMLYPGRYEIELEFTAPNFPELAAELGQLPGNSFRHIFPGIDEPAAKASYTIRNADQD